MISSPAKKVHDAISIPSDVTVQHADSDGMIIFSSNYTVNGNAYHQLLVGSTASPNYEIARVTNNWQGWDISTAVLIKKTQYFKFNNSPVGKLPKYCYWIPIK